MVVASSTADNIGSVNVGSRDYFQQSMKGELYLSNPLISKISGKPILVISAPVKAAGQIKGVLYAVVDLGAFTEANFDMVKEGKTGYVFMIDKAGIALAYPPDKKETMKLESVIQGSSDVVNLIASAVEEQSAATREIASNAAQTASGIQDVNKNVTDSTAMIGNITQAIDKERQSVNDISFSAVEADINSKEMMSEQSRSLDELANRFHTGDKRFDIGKIKVAHLALRTTLETVICGTKKMKPEDVTPHTECGLGQWYFGQGKTYSSLDAYKEMGVWHEKVHQIATEVVVLCANGENEKATHLLEAFREAREKLFENIDFIYLD